MPNESAKEEHIELSLDDLAGGFERLSRLGGAMMSQAAVVCLEFQEHRPGVLLVVSGDFTSAFTVKWSESTTVGQRAYWNDLEEATEYGAYAVAVLLLRALTGYTVVERSRKGTGFDWWLGNDDNLFQRKARLEVSGILRGSPRRVNARLKARLTQATRSDYLDLPLYVIVVEFGTPEAKVAQR